MPFCPLGLRSLKLFSCRNWRKEAKIRSVGGFVIYQDGNFREFARFYSYAVYTVLPVKLVGKQAFLFLCKDRVRTRWQFYPKTPFTVAFGFFDKGGFNVGEKHTIRGISLRHGCGLINPELAFYTLSFGGRPVGARHLVATNPLHVSGNTLFL